MKREMKDEDRRRTYSNTVHLKKRKNHKGRRGHPRNTRTAAQEGEVKLFRVQGWSDRSLLT